VLWAPVLVVSLAWLYGAPLVHLAGEWLASADASYGLVMAGVAAALAWKRRRVLTSSVDAPDRLGLALLLSGLTACLLGRLAADVFVTRASFVLVIAGVLGFVAGRSTLRAFAAPLLFLLLALPLPTLVVNAITLPLQLVASRLAEAGLAAASVPVFREGNLLTLPGGTLEVAQACSGLRSAISLTAIAVVLAWSISGGRRRGVRRLLLVACAVPVAVIVNGFRIAVTGLAVEAWGPAAARDPWHELIGWATFIVSVAVMLLVRRALTTSARSGARARDLVAA
jgi:exosortase